MGFFKEALDSNLVENHARCNNTGLINTMVTPTASERQLCTCPQAERLARSHADPNCPVCHGTAVVPIYGAEGRNLDGTDRRKACLCASGSIQHFYPNW